MIENVSCIRFRNQSQVQHKDYIHFTKGFMVCNSNVGRNGTGRQNITLDEDCAKDYIIIHEV